jgi:hypothetical protein
LEDNFHGNANTIQIRHNNKEIASLGRQDIGNLSKYMPIKKANNPLYEKPVSKICLHGCDIVK